MSDSKHFVENVSDKTLVRDGFVMECIGVLDEEGSSTVCKQSNLYKKNIWEALQRQVNMAQEGAQVWLRKPVLPTNDEYVAHLLATTYIQIIYEDVRLEGMSCLDAGIV